MSAPERDPRTAPAVLRLLLRLYAPAVRREYGAQALDVLRADLDEARARGGVVGALRRIGLLTEFALHGVLSRTDGLVDAIGDDAMHGWLQDAKLAVRSLVRRPGFSLLAVGSLTIGVGANASMFSLVDALLLRRIPGVVEPERVVELVTRRFGNDSGWSYPDFEDVREEIPLEAIAAFDAGPVSLSDDQGGERLLALYTTDGYLDVMGVQPVLGRTFAPDETELPSTNFVAILSHATWVSRFEADPDILGRVIRLNREAYTVVGVAPAHFVGHQFGIQPAFYLPLTQSRAAREDPERFFHSRGTVWAQVVGRMAPDTDVAEIDTVLGSLFARLADEYPDSNANTTAWAAVASLAPAGARSIMAAVFALIGALMLLVLAATCANVGGMLLAHASAREREMAVRVALGSGQARLVRHLFTEAMLLFALGGAGGVLLAMKVVPLIDLNRMIPSSFPITLELSLEWRLVAFGVALTTVTGLVFGLIPAFQVARHDVAATLRDGTGGTGRRASRLRRFFVGGQVAVSLLLLAAAGLFTRSAQIGADVDPGFDPTGVFVTSLDLSLEGYTDPDRANVFLTRLLDELSAMPDAEGATVATDLPGDGGTSSTPVYTGPRPPDGSGGIQSHYGYVSRGYFETLRIVVLEGRDFDADDGPDTELVAIVNRTFAERAWPQEEPLGRTISFGLDPRSYTVVGIVADTNSDLITDGATPQVFGFLPQNVAPNVHVAVRSSGAADDFVARLRRTMQAVDPALALSATRSHERLAGLATLPHRIAAWIASSLGTLALLLSALGLYGVVALVVTQQTREIGVRIVLGARRRRVLSEVLLRGFVLALPGIGVGAALAIGLGQVLQGSFLYVSPLDPVAFGSVAVVLLGVVLGACFVPARRAAALEPMEALRHE